MMFLFDRISWFEPLVVIATLVSRKTNRAPIDKPDFLFEEFLVGFARRSKFKWNW